MSFSVQSSISLVINSGDNFASRSAIVRSSTLASGSTPPATQGATFRKILASGHGQIDLTSIPGEDGVPIDGTGLKVQKLFLENDNGTSGHDITIANGSTNGYSLVGSLTLSPGDRVYFEKFDTAHDVDSTHKLIDIGGTGSEELVVGIVLG